MYIVLQSNLGIFEIISHFLFCAAMPPDRNDSLYKGNSESNFK